MKLTNQLNKEGIINLYFENKDYLLPVFAIIVSFFLFFIFIVPQILSFPSRKQDVDAETAKLNKIKESEKILSAANKNLIDSQLKTASKTLPANKAFEDVLNGISTAATLSNSQIESYQFRDQGNALNGNQKFLSLNFNVTIIGNVEQAIEFINQIHKTYPISEAINISSSEGSSTISMLFYYRPFPSIGAEDRTQIRNMSAREKAALVEISKWNDTSIGNIFNSAVNASSSAENKSSPF